MIVIDNVPGAGGAIALAQAFRRPPDGYTIIVWSPPSEYVLQLQGRIQSTVDDWVQIGATNSDPGVVAVATNSRFKSFKDILDASRSSEKRLSVGTIGRTTGSALSAMMYQTAFKVRWGIVPFDGGGDVTTALIGGHVDFALRQGGMYEFHPSKLRILAIANKVRIKELPDVPTIKEATGVEIVYSAYRGFAVRNGTPDNILDLLRATFAEAAKAPAVADKQFDTSGFRYELLDGKTFQAESKKQAQIVERYKREILGK